MSIHKLMENEAARDAYLAIPATAAPDILADDYITAKLAGNDAHCLAIEEHLRDLARVHFNVPVVLDSLAKMEKYKAMRKPGARAPKMLQDIAGQIELLYKIREYELLDDGRILFMVRLGGEPGAGKFLRVTCENMPGAVALVVAKYRRGLPRGFGDGRAKRD